MTSSNNVRDYNFLRDRESWKVSDTNSKYLEHFITVQRVKGIRLSSINAYVANISIFLRVLNLEDALTATKDDTLRSLLELEDRLSDYSINNLLIAVKLFYKEYYSKSEVDDLFPVKRRKVMNTKETSDYITHEDVMKMRNYVESRGDLRGVALIMMLYGTGARISELLDTNIGDVEIRQYNGIITVDGKTGRRKIPFVIGLPELVTWLNAHPLKRPDAPIFVGYNTRGNQVKKMTAISVENWFRNLKKAVGIPNNVKCTPHAFRHLLATTMAKKLTLREMNRLFGWSDGGNTVLTYVHTSDQDLEASILESNGIQQPEKVEKEPQMFIQCPSCSAILPPDAIQCPKCRMILDPVLAVKLSQVSNDMSKREMVEMYFENK